MTRATKAVSAAVLTAAMALTGSAQTLNHGATGTATRLSPDERRAIRLHYDFNRCVDQKVAQGMSYTQEEIARAQAVTDAYVNAARQLGTLLTNEVIKIIRDGQRASVTAETRCGAELNVSLDPLIKEVERIITTHGTRAWLSEVDAYKAERRAAPKP